MGQWNSHLCTTRLTATARHSLTLVPPLTLRELLLYFQQAGQGPLTRAARRPSCASLTTFWRPVLREGGGAHSYTAPDIRECSCHRRAPWSSLLYTTCLRAKQRHGAEKFGQQPLSVNPVTPGMQLLSISLLWASRSLHRAGDCSSNAADTGLFCRASLVLCVLCTGGAVGRWVEGGGLGSGDYSTPAAL